MPQMTERQTRFFRELLAPFPPHAYFKGKKGGREYTYLKARVIMNRLDDVVGPTGWTAEYTETSRGYRCRIRICCPDDADGTAWYFKEDGGGPEDMGSYDKNGEWEVDVDNDEKSAYTNAFRRAAMVWGFGRELYNEGMPRWLCDLYGTRPVSPATEPPAPQSNGRHEPTPPPQRQQPREPEAAPQRGQDRPQRQHDFRPPGRPGKAAYAWLKSLEDHYKRDDILRMATGFLKKRGWGTRTDEIDAEQLKELTTRIVNWIKTWDEYDGIFDGVQDSQKSAGEDSPLDRQEGAKATTQPTRTQDNLGGLKKSIVAACTTVVQKRTGREPNQDEIAAAIGEIAAMVPDGGGVSGQVMDRLRDCTDRAWLMNIQKEAMRQVERAAEEAASGDIDDIPF